MLYQQRYDKSLDSIRAALFARKIAGKRHVPSKLSNLPLTVGAFRLHCARAHYQTVLWKSAGKPSLPPLVPEQFGWEKRSNMLQPVYLSDDKAVVPDEVLHLTSCVCKSGCIKFSLSCTEFCHCSGERNCVNMVREVPEEKLSGVEEDNDSFY